MVNRPDVDKDLPSMLKASHLHAGHIDETIRFQLFDDTKAIWTVITAELRQIYHVGGYTTIHVGVGAEVEYTLEPDHHVTFAPPRDYSDWAQFTMPEV